jgi:hypothetical protein
MLVDWSGICWRVMSARFVDCQEELYRSTYTYKDQYKTERENNRVIFFL